MAVEPIIVSIGADANIRAAATLAHSIGGGVRVKIPSGRINLTSSLPTYDGVIYEGTPAQIDYRGGQTQGAGGTILVGDGTFPAIAYHDSDLSVAPTVYNDFIDGMLKGFGAMDITFENFSYGIKIGAKYNPGIQGGRFERLNFVNCQQWGAWFENYWECEFHNLNAVSCRVGGIARVGSGASAMNCGNSRWYGTSCTIYNGNIRSRGICMWSRFASAINNETMIGEGVQRTVISSVSQAATMANGQANITVTDGTAFSVDLPVTTSASVNGFTQNQIYFVASVAGNVITLRNTAGFGSAINATGNTAVNITSKGYAPFEFAGLDSSCLVTGPTSMGFDSEGLCSMQVLTQRCTRGNYMPSYVDRASAGNCYVVVVSRTAFGQWWNGEDTAFDDDSSSFNTKYVWNSSKFYIETQDLILNPSASITPTKNGQLVVQATSNTSVTFKLKGSDGTVRSGSITLS